MDKLTHQMRLSQWTSVVKACSESGLSKEEWCRQNNINIKVYYYWQRRVREAVAPASERNALAVREPAFIEVTPDSLLPDEHISGLSESSLTIEINGIKLFVNEATSDSLLRRVCGVLINA